MTAKRRSFKRRVVLRAILLLLTAAGLYGVWPGLLEVFSAWPDLLHIQGLWFLAALGLESASFVCLWSLTALALGRPGLFVPATSQLAANAVSRIIPGGAATAGALQYRMLAATGLGKTRLALALTATTLLNVGTLLALPLLIVPAVLAGLPVDRGLWQTAIVGLIGLSIGGLIAAAALAVDRPLLLAGRVLEWTVNHLRRSRPPATGLPAWLLQERDLILRDYQKRWPEALALSVGKVGLDFYALLACLAAVGATPRPSLVLLSFVVSGLLTMVPITPGGLGFVETGLVATLGLAGVGGAQAALATLAYRLVSFWLPIPAGAPAYWLFRRRYPAAVAGESLLSEDGPAAADPEGGGSAATKEKIG